MVAAQGNWTEVSMFLFRRAVLSFVLTFASSIASAGFGTCTLVNSPLATGTDPVGFVRVAMRADGRPVLAYTSDVHNDSALYLYDCANPVCSAGHAVYLDSSYNYFGAPGILVRADARPLIIATHRGGLRL